MHAIFVTNFFEKIFVTNLNLYCVMWLLWLAQTMIPFNVNKMDGTIVIDLRPQVNLGGGLYNFNTEWRELTTRFIWPPLISGYINLYDQDHPFIQSLYCICTTTGRVKITELLSHCPLCGCFLYLV